MEDDTTNKQNYLKKEIIEGGFNPEDFLQFLVSCNPDNADHLESWKMADLIEVVHKFKQKTSEQQKPTNKSERGSDKKIEEPLSEQKQVEINKLEKKEIEKNEAKYYQVVKCQKKKAVSEMGSAKLEIKIEKYEKKQGGIFEKAYICYWIMVEPLKIRTERRYSDFEWLRDKLHFLYPGLPIPPLSKKGHVRRYDDKHLRKRALMLEMFLNKLVSMPELKSQIIFKDFITITDRSAFEKFKAKYKNLNSEVDMNKIENLEGETKLTISKEMNNFLINSSNYFANTQPEVKKIYKDFKACATALQTCSETFKEIGLHCNRLSIQDLQFRSNNKLGLKPNNIYSNFELITMQYSSLLQDQAKLLRNELYGLIKYESLYMVNLLDSFQVLGAKQQAFHQARTNLLKKKLRLYQEGNVSKWGSAVKITQKPATKEEAFNLMLTKQTAETIKLRDNYALYNHQMSEQCERYFRETNRYLAKYIRNYVQLQSKLNSSGMILWADLLGNIMGMEEDKNIVHTVFS